MLVRVQNPIKVIKKPTETEKLQQQLFDTQTTVLEKDIEMNRVGQQIFNLQAELLMKGVL